MQLKRHSEVFSQRFPKLVSVKMLTNNEDLSFIWYLIEDTSRCVSDEKMKIVNVVFWVQKIREGASNQHFRLFDSGVSQRWNGLRLIPMDLNWSVENSFGPAKNRRLTEKKQDAKRILCVKSLFLLPMIVCETFFLFTGPN